MEEVNKKNEVVDLVEKIQVSKLFDSVKYVVPIYQRNFAWDETQIIQLIEDISDWDSTEENSSSMGGRDSSPHYNLGLLVVNKEDEDIFEVIDGQQRLTTLYLIDTYLNGGKPAKEDALQYEAREKYKISLKNPGADPKENGNATEIYKGYDVIRKYFENQPSVEDEEKDFKEKFKDKLRNVYIIRVQVPENIDLNHYFEIMNTRGEQLEAHQIAKAYFLRNIINKKEQFIASKIWEACSNMDSYVNMNFEKNLRELFFSYPKASSKLETIPGRSFDPFNIYLEYLQKNHQEPSNSASKTKDNFTDQKLEDIFENKEGIATLEDILKNKSLIEFKGEEISKEKNTFGSIISFPNFLLQVNSILNDKKIEDRIYNNEETNLTENDNSLDDKHLLRILESNWKSDNSTNDEQKKKQDLDYKAKAFITALLEYRALFDRFILKRSKDNDSWELKNPYRKFKNRDDTLEVMDEQQRSNQKLTNQLMLLQSALRITYTSPKTMHWITKLLRHLKNKSFSNQTETPKIDELIYFLESYCCKKVKASEFDKKRGFDIARIVFTYLDYLLIRENDKLLEPKLMPEIEKFKLPDNWEFQFRNSIEHFYPQHPDNKEGADTWGDVDIFGNLALVTSGINARFSNSFPSTKAKDYKNIVQQSPKLKLMADITEKEGWTYKQAERHGQTMIELLKKELSTHNKESDHSCIQSERSSSNS